jgi:Protein of unknown function (DUF1499)
MISKAYHRPVSRAARLSQALGAFALTLFIVAALLHRLRQISTPDFLAVVGVVTAAGILGAVSAAAGFYDLWKDGAFGGRRSAAGLALALLALTPLGLALYHRTYLPQLADISTDLADPPQFSSKAEPGLDAAKQSAAYPAVTGRRYAAPPDRVFSLAERLMAEKGWRVLPRQGDAPQGADLVIEAEVTSLALGFTDFVVVRVTDEGATTFVDMRSRSGYGRFDFGSNAARIVDFLQKLDELAAGA